MSGTKLQLTQVKRRAELWSHPHTLATGEGNRDLVSISGNASFLKQPFLTQRCGSCL